MYRSAALVFLLLCVGACSSDDESSPVAADPGAAKNPCQDGFALGDDGLCTEVAAADCGPGTMPEIGHAECQPVGWTGECPPGLVRDGWSCKDAVPTSCPATMREDIASGACVPVGDCNAPFPPASATMFVDPNGPVDATHFKTLTAAMNASPAGAVVAVEAGTYSEVLEVSFRPVTIIGRCAEKVIVASDGGPRAGLYLKDVTGATVRGLTISGFPGGILVESADSVVVEDVIVRNDTLAGAFVKMGSHLTMRRSKIANTTLGTTGHVGGGIVVYDGSTLALEDSTVTDNYFRNATVSGAGSRIDAKNVFFARNTALPASEPEGGIAVDSGGALTLSRSIVTDSVTSGVRAFGAGTTVDIDESIIRRAQGALKDDAGIAVFAFDNAAVTMRKSAVAEQPVVGVYAAKSAHVRIESSVVLGPKKDVHVEVGRGLQAVEGGTVDVHDTAFIGLPQSGIGLQQAGIGTFDRVYVRDTYPIRMQGASFNGFGMLVEESSKATITRSTFENNALAGIDVNQGAVATADGVLVRGTKEVASTGIGSALQVTTTGNLSATRSAFVRNVGTSAVVAGGTLALTDCSMRSTLLDKKSTFGHAISVFDEGHVELLRTSVSDNTGVGVVAAGGQAWVRNSTFARNKVAIHAQDGSSVVESDADAELTVGELRVSTDTRFVDNGARVGTGQIPIPKPPLQ